MEKNMIEDRLELIQKLEGKRVKEIEIDDEATEKEQDALEWIMKKSKP